MKMSSRWLASALAGATMLIAATSQAGWAGGTVDYIRVNTKLSQLGLRTAGFSVKINGVTCAGSPNNELQHNPTSESAIEIAQTNRMIDILTQAKINGMSVNVETSGCTVISVTLH